MMARRKVQVGDLAVVEWIDATELESGWHTRKDSIRLRCPRCVSVGRVVVLDDEQVTLVADYSPDPSDAKEGRVTAIPLGMVAKMRRLGEQ